MKKLTAFILSLILVFSLCACDAGSKATDSDLTQEEIDRILAEMDGE